MSSTTRLAPATSHSNAFTSTPAGKPSLSLPKLQRINESGVDDRAKIEEAMVLLFGKPLAVEV